MIGLGAESCFSDPLLKTASAGTSYPLNRDANSGHLGSVRIHTLTGLGIEHITSRHFASLTHYCPTDSSIFAEETMAILFR